MEDYTERTEKQIDNKYAALKLVHILFNEGLINFETYQKILDEYQNGI